MKNIPGECSTVWLGPMDFGIAGQANNLLLSGGCGCSNITSLGLLQLLFCFSLRSKWKKNRTTSEYKIVKFFLPKYLNASGAMIGVSSTDALGPPTSFFPLGTCRASI